jgi:hypothetical protein
LRFAPISGQSPLRAGKGVGGNASLDVCADLTYRQTNWLPNQWLRVLIYACHRHTDRTLDPINDQKSAHDLIAPRLCEPYPLGSNWLLFVAKYSKLLAKTHSMLVT